MKYLKKFNNINDYNDYEIDPNFQYPNVSLILEGGDEEMDVKYNSVFDIPAEVGSLCLYDNRKGKCVFLKKEYITQNTCPLNRYTPIGVVVVPDTHNMYGEENLAIISLVNMNPNDPDNGGDSITIPFGPQAANGTLNNFNQIGIISNDLNSTTIIKGLGFGYVPSTNIYDYFVNETIAPAVGSGLDTIARYPSVGVGNLSNSPYLEDGSRNTNYYSKNGTTNCLSDLNGKNNNNTIIALATKQTNWKTDATISTASTTGYYPASCCCWRFNTKGTKQGDWFLPSAGEIGYLSARFIEIQNTIIKAQEVFGGNYATPLVVDGNYWTSTQYSGVNQRYLYTGIGGIGHTTKTTKMLVRPYTIIKSNR